MAIELSFLSIYYQRRRELRSVRPRIFNLVAGAAEYSFE